MFTQLDLKDPVYPKSTVQFRIDPKIGTIPIPKKKQNVLKIPLYVGPRIQYIPYTDVINVPCKLIKDYEKKGLDPKDKVDVYLHYFLGQPKLEKPAGMEPYLTGTYGEIILRNGILNVASNEKNLYKYLYYCNFNSTNEYRDTAKISFCYEYIENKDILQKDEIRKTRIKAMNLAYEVLTDEEITRYAQSLNIDTNEGIDVVRAKMGELAEEEPEAFIKNLDSPDLYYKALVNDSVFHKIIEYSPSLGEWNFIMGGKRELLLRVPKGRDKDDAIIQFLLKKTDTLGFIEESLGKAKKAGKEPAKEPVMADTAPKPKGNPNFAKK